VIQKFFMGFIGAALLSVSALAQGPSTPGKIPLPPNFPAKTAGVQKEGATPLASSTNKVDGLLLTEDQTVSADEGFVVVKATCSGPVSWLVLGGIKVKYIEVPGGSVIVATPANAGTISVFCVGVVNGKTTEFAQTTITVQGGSTPPGPGPAPGPGPGPAPGPASPYHVTMVVDTSVASPQSAAILNSQNVRNAITSKGNFLRVYDIKSPTLQQKRLDGLVQQAGGPPVIIIQRNDGFVIGKWKMPATEQEVINLIQQNTGG
jgi:hypothetical protein